MAGNSRIEDLYFRFINGFVADLKSDEFYDYFINMVKGGTNNMTLNEKYVERNIDIRWVEAIEDTIIPLDNIIRNPNRFIKNIEEVVKDWYPIVEQRSEDSRLVIIDDGSKDATYEKLLELAKTRPQLEPLHKENGGHGATIYMDIVMR